MYPTWDFDGQPGYTTINGIVCIDGCAGRPAASRDSGHASPRSRRPSPSSPTKGPWLDLLGVGLPWATGVFSEVGAVTAALKDPNGPATTFEDFPLLPGGPEGAGTGDQPGAARLCLRLQDVARRASS